MFLFLLWGLICFALNVPVLAKKIDQDIEKIEIELNLFGGNAKITYDDEWKSKAEISYAQKKKIVAYKDKENDWCLVEKIERHRKSLVNEESYSREFRISKRALEKDQVEKLAGKKILIFCTKYPVFLLIPYTREYQRVKSRREERVKRELYPPRGNESDISHQEISKKLLEDLENAQSLTASRAFSGKAVKRNVDGRTENLGGQYPSSSAKVAQPSGIDYHTHIRNNIYPRAHAVHPIDITSSVTISTGSSHPVWSYPPSSGGYHNTTADSHQNLSPHSRQNATHHSAHDVQHSPSLHQGALPSSGQSQIHYTPSASSKSQPGPASYPPSSSTKSQIGMAHYPPSSVSKSQQGPAHYPPSASIKTQQSAGYYPPSSTSKTQPPVHYPPSAATKTQQPTGYYPPSSSSKTQAPSHFPPSASSKYHPTPGHYPPSSSSKPLHPVGYPPSATSKSQQTPAYYPSSSSAKPQQGSAFYNSHHHPQHYPPSSSSNSRPTLGHFPPSSVSKTAPPHYPPSSTSKTHQPHQNITSGDPNVRESEHSLPAAKFPALAHYSPTGSGGQTQFPTSHRQQPAYIPPSSTSKIHYHPQNRTHVQYNTLYSLGGAPGVYAPRFPPSSTSKIHPPLPQFSPSTNKVNHVSHGESHGVPHREYPYSVAHYPPSSTTKFHTKLDQSGGQFQTPHFPSSSTGKIHYSGGNQESPAPVLERPAAKVNTHEGHPPSSTAKVNYSVINNVPQFAFSSTSKMHYIPLGSHFHGGNHEGQTYPPSSTSKLHYSPSSGSPSPAQIHQPPVTGHFPSSAHAHNFPKQYYPPSASHKQPNSASHHPHHQPVAYYPPSSTSKLHHPSQQNLTSHLPPAYFPPSSTSKLQPSSVGLRHDTHVPGSEFQAPAQVPYYQPSSYGKGTFDHSHAHQYPYYPPSSTSYHTHNESSSEPGQSVPSPSRGHGLHPHPQYPPSSSSKLHPNGSETAYPGGQSVATPLHPMPQHPSGAQHYRQNVSGVHSQIQTPQYQQPNFAPHHAPQFQQGSSRPCQGPLYSITTRTVLAPNGAIQRPISVKNNGESPCGNVKQSIPYSLPCGATIRNSQSIRSQSPCMLNPQNGNQRKSMRSVLVPGPAMLPSKRISEEQGEFGSSDGVVVTNTGESQAELLDGIRYPISHQQFSHLKTEKENSTSKEAEDFEGDAPEDEQYKTKYGKTGDGESEKNDDEEAEVSVKSEEEEEEVKEGDVLEPGDRILGKNGYTISDGFRGRVVSVSGQVGKTRAEKDKIDNKKSNSGQFRYSSELGRYAKDSGEKGFSDCQGEVTFTCTEFLGSNGRAKICKPNPRRNPDGSPC